LSLLGAVSGYQAWSVVGTGNTAFYCLYAVDATGNPSGAWECGLGTYTLSGTTLARTTVYSNSSGTTSALNLAAGTYRVILTPVAQSFLNAQQYSVHGPEISVTGTVVATVGRMHDCSGTSSNYTVTLPAAANCAGQSIGFRMDAGLTKLVSIKGNASENVDGQNTRVMWSGETAILYCDGSNWFKVAGRSLPMMCQISRSSNQTIGAVTVTKVSCDLSDLDNTGLMADTGNGRLVVQRTGNYLTLGQISTTATSAGYAGQVQVRVHKAGSFYFNGVSTDIAPTTTHVVTYAAGDTVELYTFCSASGFTLYGDTSQATRIRLVEVPGW
jgi:hypothetical protein